MSTSHADEDIGAIRMSVKKCLSCDNEIGGDTGKNDAGRGLCVACHSRHVHRGTIDQFPRKTWRAEELIAEADILRARGLPREEVAERLGVKWASITSAKQRLRQRADRKTNAVVYEEHVKLEKIAPLSQSIGEFVEWLSSEGVHLMRWTETVDSEVCGGTFLSDCRGEMCDTCGGAMLVEVKRNAWAPHGVSITNMLASFFDIDQKKIEEEKRHMLEHLRKRNGASE